MISSGEFEIIASTPCAGDGKQLHQLLYRVRMSGFNKPPRPHRLAYRS